MAFSPVMPWIFWNFNAFQRFFRVFTLSVDSGSIKLTIPKSWFSKVGRNYLWMTVWRCCDLIPQVLGCRVLQKNISGTSIAQKTGTLIDNLWRFNRNNKLKENDTVWRKTWPLLSVIVPVHRDLFVFFLNCTMIRFCYFVIDIIMVLRWKFSRTPCAFVIVFERCVI